MRQPNRAAGEIAFTFGNQRFIAKVTMDKIVRFEATVGNIKLFAHDFVNNIYKVAELSAVMKVLLDGQVDEKTVDETLMDYGVTSTFEGVSYFIKVIMDGRLKYADEGAQKDAAPQGEAQSQRDSA